MTLQHRMNRERLEKMAAFLETVPPERFTLKVWWKETPTGFIGDPIGHAIEAKLFDGLELATELNGNHVLSWPTYRGFTDEEAVAKLFGIHRREVWDLFGDDEEETGENHDYTPSQIATRIRRFVTEREAIAA